MKSVFKAKSSNPEQDAEDVKIIAYNSCLSSEANAAAVAEQTCSSKHCIDDEECDTAGCLEDLP